MLVSTLSILWRNIFAMKSWKLQCTIGKRKNAHDVWIRQFVANLQTFNWLIVGSVDSWLDLISVSMSYNFMSRLTIASSFLIVTRFILKKSQANIVRGTSAYLFFPFHNCWGCCDVKSESSWIARMIYQLNTSSRTIVKGSSTAIVASTNFFFIDPWGSSFIQQWVKKDLTAQTETCCDLLIYREVIDFRVIVALLWYNSN